MCVHPELENLSTPGKHNLWECPSDISSVNPVLIENLHVMVWKLSLVLVK